MGISESFNKGMHKSPRPFVNLPEGCSSRRMHSIKSLQGPGQLITAPYTVYPRPLLFTVHCIKFIGNLIGTRRRRRLDLSVCAPLIYRPLFRNEQRRFFKTPPPPPPPFGDCLFTSRTGIVSRFFVSFG